MVNFNSCHQISSHLPNVKADWIHDSWLDDLPPWEHTPCDGNGLGGVTVGDVLCTQLVHHVVVHLRVVAQHLQQDLHMLRTSEELKIGLLATEIILAENTKCATGCN